MSHVAIETEHQPLARFTERAYLEYAMYVVLDRALPHIGDGLKPVQRRIVYAMAELGLRGGAKPKKSARTVGDVLGKFHPHGDAACYEAMVLMAQAFACRYPLIDGQGNWGSPDDPKSFAAMRYTEARLAPYAELLLSELEQGTVQWGANYDGTQQEPLRLPARLPNILLNGTTGIAVGMATDIPPHNLREVAQACIHLLDRPEADLEALCEYIQAPDFPMACEIITPREEILAIYRSGSGSLRVRAAWERDNGDIVITALPPQVSGAKVLEQIAAQMQAKKLPLVADLRDESDHDDPTRLVIVPRSNRVDVEALMAHLFATTELERSVRVNLNIIGLDGRPQVKGLVALLGEWLAFRLETVRRRLSHRLERVEDRLHVLDGLLIAFLNIDEAIAIIRREDEPAKALVARFGLTARQAEAILELRLRHLARIEEVKIRAEQKALAAERKRLTELLTRPEKLRALVRQELAADAEQYGDARRSPVVARREAQALSRLELMPAEPLTVVLSVRGWIRSARGHEIDPQGLTFKAGDAFLAAARGRSTQPVVLLDSTGRSYSLPAHELPSARTHGEPLSGRLSLPEGADVEAVLMAEPESLWLLATTAGYGFVASFEDLVSKNRSGKAVLSISEGGRLLYPQPVTDLENHRLLAVSAAGRMLVFPAGELPRLSRGKGNRLIHIRGADLEAGRDALRLVSLIPRDCQLTLHAGKRFLSLKPGHIAEFEAGRGRRGKLLPRGLQRVERIEFAESAQLSLL